MTPSQAKAWVETLPAAEQVHANRALRGVYDDGFQTGAARLPRKNIFDPSYAPEVPAEEKPKGKAR